MSWSSSCDLGIVDGSAAPGARLLSGECIEKYQEILDHCGLGAIEDMGLEIPDVVTPASIHQLFRSSRKATDDEAAIAGWPGSRRKGEFALALADHVARARTAGTGAAVPTAMGRIFDFLYASAARTQLSPALDSDPPSPALIDT